MIKAYFFLEVIPGDPSQASLHDFMLPPWPPQVSPPHYAVHLERSRSESYLDASQYQNAHALEVTATNLINRLKPRPQWLLKPVLCLLHMFTSSVIASALTQGCQTPGWAWIVPSPHLQRVWSTRSWTESRYLHFLNHLQVTLMFWQIWNHWDSTDQEWQIPWQGEFGGMV